MSSSPPSMNKPDQKGVDLTHMPQYIKQAPWYVDQKDKEVLTHQRARNDLKKPSIDTWYRKGVKTDQQITKYRKGACTNCGAMTHTAKTCTERPRKIGAKYNHRDFAQDEIIENIQLNYEGKKDRYNGYDPDQYKQVIEEWERLNEEQKKKKEQETQEKIAKGEPIDVSSSDDDEDPDMEGQNEDQSQFANKDPRVRTTIRNLRIREDTAKYLRNLDPNSAVYDGKTRMMKENPNPNLPENQQAFKGDNYRRVTGDFITLMNQEGFVLDANQVGGVEVNNIAMPSQVEIMHKQFREKKELLKNKKMQDLISKYGGDQHLQVPEELREGMKAEIEDRLEMQKMQNHQKQATVAKFDNRGLLGVKSRFEEDNYQNSHSSVWGSYYHKLLGWGYRCCYSFVKNAKCKGEEQKKQSIRQEYDLESQIKKLIEEKHKREVDLTNKRLLKQDEEQKSIQTQQEEFKHGIQKQNNYSDKNESSSDESSSSSEDESSSNSGADSDSSGPRRKHKKRQQKQKRKTDDKSKKDSKKNDKYSKDQNRKSGYHGVILDDKVTEEEFESYRKQRDQFDDPMRHFKN
eukprot:403345699